MDTAGRYTTPITIPTDTSITIRGATTGGGTIANGGTIETGTEVVTQRDLGSFRTALDCGIKQPALKGIGAGANVPRQMPY